MSLESEKVSRNHPQKGAYTQPEPVKAGFWTRLFTRVSVAISTLFSGRQTDMKPAHQTPLKERVASATDQSQPPATLKAAFQDKLNGPREPEPTIEMQVGNHKLKVPTAFLNDLERCEYFVISNGVRTAVPGSKADPRPKETSEQRPKEASEQRKQMAVEFLMKHLHGRVSVLAKVLDTVHQGTLADLMKGQMSTHDTMMQGPEDTPTVYEIGQLQDGHRVPVTIRRDVSNVKTAIIAGTPADLKPDNSSENTLIKLTVTALDPISVDELTIKRKLEVAPKKPPL